MTNAVLLDQQPNVSDVFDAETRGILDALYAGQTIRFDWNLGNYFLSDERHRWVSTDVLTALLNAGLLGTDGIYGYGLVAAPAPVAERLTLGTPVAVERLGIVGIISGRSTCDGNRYRVSWFDRHFWTVRHQWVEREVITAIEQKQTAAAA